ncbi:prepilin-type N-terminal cleavage/methylation domain-containing protein, partial [Escherichia coli]
MKRAQALFFLIAKTGMIKKKGFTLLEVTIVLGIGT